jgi:hypothetical protein
MLVGAFRDLEPERKEVFLRISTSNIIVPRLQDNNRASAR